MCVEKTPERAAVMRYDANGGNGRVFSSGLRNAVGIAVNPVTKQIWATQNERDNIEPEHEDLPPEEINILQDGGDYGWPYCYGNRIPSPDRDFHDPARCARTIPPALEMQAHSAPLGITFLDRATMFPADWRGDAVVAFHGGYLFIANTDGVVRVRLGANGTASGPPERVNSYSAGGGHWSRSIVFGTDSAMYVTIG